MGKKYFFGNDDDGHWYQVPYELKTKWNELSNYGFDYERATAFDSTFGQYRVDSISNIIFENPILI